MNRYTLPDPKCRHKRKGIVKAGDPAGAYVATNVCDRPECIADALEWANAHHVGTAQHVTDASRNVELFAAAAAHNAEGRAV